MDLPTSHSPESVIFALDVDNQVLKESGFGSSRLDALKHCIQVFVTVKKRACSNHRFGLILLRDRASWCTRGCVDSQEELLDCAWKVGGDESSYDTCELGSIYTACRQEVRQEEKRGNKVRVLLLYGRSATIPSWQEHPDCAISMDAVYIHDRVELGVNCPQQVFNALEDHLDQVSSRTGHSAYIFECTASNTRKLMTSLTYTMWHPRQRPPQAQLPAAPVDLHTLAPMPVGLSSSSPPRSPAQASTLSSSPPVPSQHQGYMSIAAAPVQQQMSYAPAPQAYPSTKNGYQATRPSQTAPASQPQYSSSPSVQMPAAVGVPSHGLAAPPINQAYYQQQAYQGTSWPAHGMPQGSSQSNMGLEGQMGNVMVGVVVPTSTVAPPHTQPPPSWG